MRYAFCVTQNVYYICGMKSEQNPFLLKGYISPELFCDRVTETNSLIRNLQNSANTLLISNRRMGKTGLILHTFWQINAQEKTPCLYIDVFATKNLSDFTNQLASAMLEAFPEKNSMGRKVMNWIKSLSPVISYDSLSGLPEVSIAYSRPEQTENTLLGILKFLDKMNMPIIIAFDEFQQILHYPEKNIEALLRTHIQHLHNLRFIFSGSSKHLLTDMFADSRRLFFASTSMVALSEIEQSEYSVFIEQTFAKHHKNIAPEAIDWLLQWTGRHTYYVQYTCNRIYAGGNKAITLSIARQTASDILLEHEAIFYQYRQMLTALQWQVLSAVAREQKVYSPGSKDFVQKYQLGSASAVQRAIESLTENEMLLRDNDEKGTYIRVYNVFLSRWLEYKS